MQAQSAAFLLTFCGILALHSVAALPEGQSEEVPLSGEGWPKGGYRAALEREVELKDEEAESSLAPPSLPMAGDRPHDAVNLGLGHDKLLRMMGDRSYAADPLRMTDRSQNMDGGIPTRIGQYEVNWGGGAENFWPNEKLWNGHGLIHPKASQQADRVASADARRVVIRQRRITARNDGSRAAARLIRGDDSAMTTSAQLADDQPPAPRYHDSYVCGPIAMHKLARVGQAGAEAMVAKMISFDKPCGLCMRSASGGGWANIVARCATAGAKAVLAGKPNPAPSAVSDTAQVWSAAVAANQNPCGPIDMHKIAKAWQQGTVASSIGKVSQLCTICIKNNQQRGWRSVVDDCATAAAKHELESHNFIAPRRNHGGRYDRRFGGTCGTAQLVSLENGWCRERSNTGWCNDQAGAMAVVSVLVRQNEPCGRCIKQQISQGWTAVLNVCATAQAARRLGAPSPRRTLPTTVKQQLRSVIQRATRLIQTRLTSHRAVAKPHDLRRGAAAAKKLDAYMDELNSAVDLLRQTPTIGHGEPAQVSRPRTHLVQTAFGKGAPTAPPRRLGSEWAHEHPDRVKQLGEPSN